MPDSTQSTLPVPTAQQHLAAFADELRDIDRRLERLAHDLDTSGGALLPHEIVGTVGAVRRDLLADAIETLLTLATKTEADVLADCERVTYLVEVAR